MFREVIAKQCAISECALHGQTLDEGLPICPECGGELTPVTRLKYRLIAVVAAIALLGVGSGSALAYGMAIEQLGPVQTVCWLMGKCTLPDGLAVPASRGEWFHGVIQWNFKEGHQPRAFSRQSLCEMRDGAYWCQPRFTSANGDRFHFELLPEASYLYVLYRHPSNSMKLYPAAAAVRTGGAFVEIPYRGEVELAGPATSELFAIVSSRAPLADLAALPETGFSATKLDQLLTPLSNNSDCLVMWSGYPTSEGLLPAKSPFMRLIGLLLSLICLFDHAEAAQYALLVGIGHYPIGGGAFDLDGPRYDVPSLRSLLISRYGFGPANIVELMDGAATRSTILESLNRLVGRAGPRDRLLFYFSGHGTSAFDRNMQLLAAGIGPDSGAIVPYDASDESVDKALASIIVGRRDLRPILERLHPLARAWVVLDSCYSENAAKSFELASEGRSREIVLAKLLRLPRHRPSISAPPPGEDSTLSMIHAPEAYPYTNVVSFSAASRNEKAEDIDRRALQAGRQTVDGQPHGAFTSAFLAALATQADLNGDGQISYEEIFLATRRNLDGLARQTPHILTSGAKILKEPALGRSDSQLSPTLAAQPQPAPAVALNGVDPMIASQIGALPGVRLVDRSFDLLVRQRAGVLTLYRRSLTLIRGYSMMEVPMLLRRIAVEPEVERLLALRFEQQDFGLRVDVASMGPGGVPVSHDGAQFAVGEAVAIAAVPEKPAWLMLLNVDTDGVVSIIYRTPDGVPQLSASRVLVRTRVRRPVGAEYVKAFAFLEKPAGFTEFACRGSACPDIEPGTARYRRLLTLLDNRGPGRAESMVRLLTTE